MNKNKTKIEWVRNEDGSQGYSINPVKGLCPMACPYCYARAMYKRFKWNPDIRFEDSAFRDLNKIDRKQGQRIFVGSTMELFGDWIPEGWIKTILEYCHLYYHTTFIFLTKRPEELLRWSPFPLNCWVGVSVTNDDDQIQALAYLGRIEANVRFLSCEPLLGEIILPYQGIEKVIDWIIIGQVTPAKKATMPKIEWVKEIVEACDKAGVPVFLKDNLKPLFGGVGKLWAFNNRMILRQEMPK